MKKLIASAARVGGTAFDYGDDLMDLYDRVQKGAGFMLREQEDKVNAGYENGKPAVYIKPVSTSGGERQINISWTNRTNLST